MRGLFFVLVSFLISDIALAAPVKVEGGAVSFEATASGAGIVEFDFEGKGAGVEAQVAIDGGKIAGTFEVPLAALKTGMDMRDRHLHETLDVAKFPKAKLVLEPTPASSGKHDVKGQLTIKGVTKPAKGSCEVLPSGSSFNAKCTLDVKISDYPSLYKAGETKLSNAGVSVKDDVKVTVAFKATP